MRDTIDMAREAGAIHIHERPKEFALVGNDTIKAFEALIRADQREIDANVCESLPMQQEIDVRDECAAAIRNRGNT